MTSWFFSSEFSRCWRFSRWCWELSHCGFGAAVLAGRTALRNGRGGIGDRPAGFDEPSADALPSVVGAGGRGSRSALRTRAPPHRRIPSAESVSGRAGRPAFRRRLGPSRLRHRGDRRCRRVGRGRRCSAGQLNGSQRPERGRLTQRRRAARPASPAARRPEGCPATGTRGSAPSPRRTATSTGWTPPWWCPRSTPTTWRLRIHGKGVARPVTLTFHDLLRRELVERDITLTCVSNEVGGPYVGNARWIGVRLADLLAESGVKPPSKGGPADQLVARSVDGMTIGSPGRGRHGRPRRPARPRHERRTAALRPRLPRPHGRARPVRLRLGLQVDQGHRAHHVRRLRRLLGQARLGPQGPDQDPVPHRHPQAASPAPKAGTVMVAGVAWAQHRGIDKVEVRVDDGPWQEARLAAEDTRDTWRQWSLPWQATNGGHTLTVRATDRTGAVQTDKRARHHPRRRERMALGGRRPSTDPRTRPPPCNRPVDRGSRTAANDHRRNTMNTRHSAASPSTVAAAAVLPLALTACSERQRQRLGQVRRLRRPPRRPRPRTTARPAPRRRRPRRPSRSARPARRSRRAAPARFDGMAQDPVATAASNNPALSTLVAAVQEGRPRRHPQQRPEHHRVRADQRRLRQDPEGRPSTRCSTTRPS